jgi:hypothetical protein
MEKEPEKAATGPGPTTIVHGRIWNSREKLPQHASIS